MELVIATPLLLLLVLLIAQFALYMHATHIAQAAASEALSEARVSGGTAAAGPVGQPQLRRRALRGGRGDGAGRRRCQAAGKRRLNNFTESAQPLPGNRE